MVDGLAMRITAVKTNFKKSLRVKSTTTATRNLRGMTRIMTTSIIISTRKGLKSESLIDVIKIMTKTITMMMRISGMMTIITKQSSIVDMKDHRIGIELPATLFQIQTTGALMLLEVTKTTIIISDIIAKEGIKSQLSQKIDVVQIKEHLTAI